MESYNLLVIFGIWAVCFLLTRLGLSKLFKIAGQPPIMAWIPIVSWYYWVKMVGRPMYYFYGMLVPCLNIFFTFNLCLDTARAFGKNKFWEQFAATVLTFLYFPYLYFQTKLTFLGPSGSKVWREKNVKKGPFYREWADAILFALYIAGGMRAMFFDLYQIPTASMESNMRVGDMLVVSRTGIGMRLPFTPIALPVIAQKTLPLSSIPGFVSAFQLPYLRLPGWDNIKNNDIVVFNWPADGDEFPVDKKDNYVKRCLGIPGDKLQIINEKVFINGKLLPRVSKAQRQYIVVLKDIATTEFVGTHDLGDIKKFIDFKTGTEVKNTYTIRTWDNNVAEIKKDPLVASITYDTSARKMTNDLYQPNTTINGKTTIADLDNFGPIYLPKRGESVKLTPANFAFYERAITVYEKTEITTDGTKFFIGGNEVTNYTFKYGYYWMMGDNRYNSYDSRGWGYVPETHIIGKPMFSFLGFKKAQQVDEYGQPMEVMNGHIPNPAYKNYGPFFGIRWNKVFRPFE